MRVIFTVTAPQWGGNEKWALNAAEGLATRGHEVTVLWGRGDVGREIELRGLRGRRAPFVNGWNLVGLVILTLRLLWSRPDAVVLTRRCEYLPGGLSARLADRLTGRSGERRTPRNGERREDGRASGRRRTAVVLRMGLRRRLRDDLTTRTAFGRLADLIIVNSGAIRDGLAESGWLDPGRVRVLVNGVETEAVSSHHGRTALSELGVEGGSRVIVAAGRLNRQKGFDVLIESLAMVREKQPSAVLVILGEGKERVALERQAASARLASAVVLAGQRSDVREIMSAADVYVLSSRNEGMANTLLEAMSVGAPIVATDVPGTREAVRDRVDALVVPPGDATAMASAVLELLGDGELSSALARSALERVQNHFGLERMADELEAMLLDVVQRCSGPPALRGGHVPASTPPART
jgi:glycosyltransferase involved in cell wall biosynthesis